MRRLILVALCLFLNSAFSIDYFVDTAGKDSNYGTTSEEAFKTIGAAVKDLEPGDILPILPGEYLQQALDISCKGTDDKPITIRGTNLTGLRQTNIP